MTRSCRSLFETARGRTLSADGRPQSAPFGARARRMQHGPRPECFAAHPSARSESSRGRRGRRRGRPANGHADGSRRRTRRRGRAHLPRGHSPRAIVRAPGRVHARRHWNPRDRFHGRCSRQGHQGRGRCGRIFHSRHAGDRMRRLARPSHALCAARERGRDEHTIHVAVFATAARSPVPGCAHGRSVERQGTARPRQRGRSHLPGRRTLRDQRLAIELLGARALRMPTELFDRVRRLRVRAAMTEHLSHRFVWCGSHTFMPL